MSKNLCNQKVYENGTTVFLTNSIDSDGMGKWVQKIAEESGQSVDWHYSCGWAEILALGDLNKVRKAIVKFREIHDDFYFRFVKMLGDTFTDKIIIERIESIWEYNRNKNGLFRNICSKCYGECYPQNHAGWDPIQEGNG
jgi:hypothetical protein